MFKQFLIGTGLMCAIVGCTPSMKDVGGMNNPSLTDQDNMFFQNAYTADQTEIQSSQLALKKAQSGPVKEFATQMISDHTSAEQTLQSLASQKNVKLPTMLDSKHMDMVNDLDEKNGKDFDMAYIDLQIKAHQMTADKLNDEVNNGTDPDVKMAAQKVLDMVNMHLARAKTIKSGMM